MGYTISEPSRKAHRRTSSSSEKSASGDFFANPNKTHLENRSNSLKQCLGNPSTPTKNASALNNPTLWNSRRYDQDTNLYYYKYRHYKADIGRWLGRDPIEENGGVNLYGFVGNIPLVSWDYLGKEVKDVKELEDGNQTGGHYGKADLRARTLMAIVDRPTCKFSFTHASTARLHYRSDIDPDDKQRVRIHSKTGKVYTTREEEEGHREIFKDEIKQFQTNANDLEGTYETPDCASLANATYIQIEALFEARNRYKQVKFDRALEPRSFTQAEEDAAKASMTLAKAAVIKALKKMEKECKKE